MTCRGVSPSNPRIFARRSKELRWCCAGLPVWRSLVAAAQPAVLESLPFVPERLLAVLANLEKLLVPNRLPEIRSTVNLVVIHQPENKQKGFQAEKVQL